MLYKNKFPFRIGSTSYVIPDELLPNVQYMADKVDDIELVLFEAENESNLPDERVVSSLQTIAKEHDITYSVHFPIDRKAGAKSATERQLLLKRMISIITLTKNLPISSYILHLEGLCDEFDTTERNRWHTAVHRFCEQLITKVAIEPSLIAVENLSYQPLLHHDIVTHYGFSHCIDVGHLWLQNINWEFYIKQTLPLTKVIHFHGVNKQMQDHVSLLDHAKQEQFNTLITLLRGYSGVITLEVFSESNTFRSLATLKELWEK